MDIIKTVIPLATILIIIIPSLLIMLLNTRKCDRYKQLRFPFVALLYSVLCCVLFSLLERLSNWILGLSFVRIFIEYISPSGKLEYISLVYITIILNTALLVGFFFVKAIAKVKINKKVMPQELNDLSGIKKIYWNFINLFYDISGGKGWVRKCWVRVCVTLKYASLILSAVYILLMVFLQFPVFLNYSWIPYEFMASCVEALYIWPVISFIAINELMWFLDGKQEYSSQESMKFDHSEIKVISEYGELAEQYEKQFPERFISHFVAKAIGQKENFQNDVKTDNKLEETMKEQLISRGFTINENYLNCIRSIIQGRNALIDAALYSGFGEYLFLYLNILLSRGDNTLFLCPDEESAELIEQYIAKKFKSFNGFHPLWVICGPKNAIGAMNADVLVLTPQSILDDNIFIGQQRFFERLSTVVLVNSAEIVAKDGVLLALLAHKLTNIIRFKPHCDELQYICLSESVPPETVGTLKELLNLNTELYLCDGYQSFDNTHIMLWNYEANNIAENDTSNKEDARKATWAQDNLFGKHDSQTYWGVSLPFACVGMKYAVSKICIMSKQSSPNSQIINSINNQVNRTSDYFGTDAVRPDFNNAIILNSTYSENDYASFIIVEDELYNLPLVIYNYCRFGGTDTTMLHIISKPYMLRDYFASNAQSYINNESCINMIIPCTTDSARIVVIKILYEALKNGIEEGELVSKVSKINPDIKNIDDALEFCRKIVFPEYEGDVLENLFLFRTNLVFNRANNEFEKNTYIHLKVDTPLKKIMQESRHAKIKIRDDLFNLGVFSDRLMQHFIPSQCIVFKGEMYIIKDIEADKGIVHVTNAPDRLDSPLDYIQVRKYTLSGKISISERITVPLEQNKDRASEGYVIERFCACVTVDTPAYYVLEASSPRIDLVNVLPRPLEDNVRSMMQRKHQSADIVLIKIKNVGKDKSDKVAFLLSVILNEMLKTLFPYSYKCIAACPVLNDSQAIYGDAMGGKISDAYPQVELDILENKHCEDDVEILLIEDSQNDTGMLNALLRDNQFPFRSLFNNILDYLKWFKNYECSGNISNKYLYFGSETIPECFDIETLILVLKDYETVMRLEARKVDHITLKGQCSYCHRDLFNVEYKEINDKAGKHNRKLCSDCAKLIITDENKLKELYIKTRRYLCDTYGIDISESINVRFASAEKIRERMKITDQRVVIGFADPNSRELWVESDAPSTNIMDVLVHELTHIWQFDNIDVSDLVYVEGHASYVEIQYMRKEHRNSFADWQELSLSNRNDEYGEGFRRIRAELEKRGDTNSFSYMLELFGDDGSGRPPFVEGETEGDEDNTDEDDDKKGDDTSDVGEINRNPNSVPKYAYELLDDKSKSIYIRLKKAITDFQEEFTISEPIFNSEEIIRIIDYIKRDSPEIIWLGQENTVFSNPLSKIATSVKLSYCMTKQTAVKRQKEIDETLESFLSFVNSEMSDYDVVLKIYENIISLVDYDSIGLDNSEKENINDKPDDLRSIYGAFVKKKAVCAGYARAIQYLLNKVGIECTYIKGNTSKGETQEYHAWNLLKLEGDYYYMDVTWGDYSNTDSEKSQEGISYDYFCITTEELLKDHTPDEDFPVPICTATKCNYRKRSGK